MKRSKSLQADPATYLAWQRRTQQTARDRQRSTPQRVAKRVTRRRNDGPWRREVLDARGPQCRVMGCGRMTDLQVDHLIPRAHGGPSILANGVVLCREHHEAKTDHELLVDPSWLDPDQLEWLADHNHAEWLFDGVVVGRHRKIFADGPDRRPTETKGEI